MLKAYKKSLGHNQKVLEETMGEIIEEPVPE